jgi:hypothetical protein
VYLERWPTTLRVARRLLAERADGRLNESKPAGTMPELSSRKIFEPDRCSRRGHDVERSADQGAVISATHPDSHRQGSDSQQHGTVLGRATAQTAARRSAGVGSSVEVEDDLEQVSNGDRTTRTIPQPLGERSRTETARQVASEPGRMATQWQSLKQGRPMPVDGLEIGHGPRDLDEIVAGAVDGALAADTKVGQSGG